MSASYERLSMTESAMLAYETPSTPMHLGAVVVLGAAPLRNPDGGVTIGRIRAHVASRLRFLPRYRQRIAWTPIEGHPVWVDTGDPDITHHVRHVALPQPRGREQLEELIGAILSRPLDPQRPLWELWVVDDIGDDRFAVVAKVHHCLADGASGLDALFSVVMSPVPEDGPAAASDLVQPTPPARPAPGTLTLLMDVLAQRARMPFAVIRDVGASLLGSNGNRWDAVERLAAFYRLVASALPPPAATPLNGPVGPHRSFAWCAFDLEEVRGVKRRFGGSVNDVGLAAVAGGVGAFFRRRGVTAEGLDYRVMIPASTRGLGGSDGAGGNGNGSTISGTGVRVSGWLMPFPIDERSPRRRYDRVRKATSFLKESKQILGPEVLFRLGEIAGPPLSSLGVRLTAWLQPYNLIVTNVPGPQIPFYLLGAPVLEAHPFCPLFANQGFAVALLSYDGKLFVGVNADRDQMPDVRLLVDEIEAAFEKLRQMAATATEARAARSRRPRTGRRRRDEETAAGVSQPY